MKKIYAFILILFGFFAANSQNPLYVDNSGYVRYNAPKKDTVVIHDTIRTVKDTIIYKDRVVYRDTTIYKDTCTTQPPTGIDYLALPLSGAIDLSGKSNIIVENKRFSNISGVALKLYSGANNITIRNCFFQNIEGEMIELENATNVTIENCLFARGWTGVYAVASKGVKVINCQFVNMKMKPGTYARGQFVQFNSCSDGLIENCRGENFQDESNPEDQISCYASSSITIRNNIFRGGGPSGSGGGIVLGDHGGNNCLAENNTLFNPGQYGMAVAGGANMRILNNKIWGDQLPWSNVGLYVWNQNKDDEGNLILMSDITVKENKISWLDRDGNLNTGWNAGNGEGIDWEDSTSITIEEINVPEHLIDFVTPEQLLLIKK